MHREETSSRLRPRIYAVKINTDVLKPFTAFDNLIAVDCFLYWSLVIMVKK